MELTQKQPQKLVGPVDEKVIGDIKTQLKDNKDTEKSLFSQGKFHNDKKKRNKEYINEQNNIINYNRSLLIGLYE